MVVEQSWFEKDTAVTGIEKKGTVGLHDGEGYKTGVIRTGDSHTCIEVYRIMRGLIPYPSQ